jgi:hypothetical protein
MVVTITAMRRYEKPQMIDETRPLDHGEIDLDGFASSLINAFAARFDREKRPLRLHRQYLSESDR